MTERLLLSGNKVDTGLFCCTVSGNGHDSYCTMTISSVNVCVTYIKMSPLSTAFIFLHPLFPPLGISISLLHSCSLVMMLTGSNAFGGLEGERCRMNSKNS